MKYRIIKVPQIGSDKYRVEGLEVTTTDKEPTEEWCVFDCMGYFWVNWGIHGGISLPQLELFVSKLSAIQWIIDRKEYLKKKSEVVYESE